MVKVLSVSRIRTSNVILILSVSHLIACGGSDDQIPPKKNIRTPVNSSDISFVDPPSNLTVAVQTGTIGQSAPKSEKKYLHISWENKDQASVATIIEAKKSTEESFSVIATQSSQTSTLDFDLGFISSETPYLIRARNSKSGQLSNYTTIQSVLVDKSQLRTPTGFGLQASGNEFKYGWGEYPDYAQGEHVGFMISYTIYFKDGSRKFLFDDLLPPETRNRTIVPCKGLTAKEAAKVDGIASDVSAIGASDGVASSNPSPTIMQVGCPQ